jgi:threonylcarbamoyladenosine tRNA methylthiotransferase MtaB
MKKIAVTTFGCKVNQYESACIIDDFKRKGYESVAFGEEADVYVVNSCSVTSRTDFKARNAIRKALEQKEKNINVKIVVTGCYAQMNRDKIYKMGAVDLVVDNNHKNDIISFVEREVRPEFIDDTSSFEYFTEQNTATLMDRERAFIKIQDGCDYFCTYCTISYARGKPRSRNLEDIMEQIKIFVTQGYQEVVLTGVNLGLYGRDLKSGENLLTVLNKLEAIEGLKKIRLSSLEPQLISEDLISFFAESEKVCPHFHIPLQSGSDKVLEDMRRPYTTADFRTLIEKITYKIPDVAIGTDIIFGFPTETDELFNETIRFVEGLPLVYAHIFPFSARPGTDGAKLLNNLSSNTVRERCTTAKEVFNRKREEYITRLISSKAILSGVIERKRSNYWTALSDHYIRIYLKNTDVQEGALVTGIATHKLLDGVEVSLDD